MMSSVFLCFMYSNRHRFNRIPAGRVAELPSGFVTAYPRIHETLSVGCLFLTLCWLLRISIGMPNFEMPNLDSVNFCTIRV